MRAAVGIVAWLPESTWRATWRLCCMAHNLLYYGYTSMVSYRGLTHYCTNV
ncbi:hypothetical protein [Rickettsia endosymbiont of Orchestes rusci]|uniref:hypothetical protein n=1 Tax=Rickettsia endosymbiont of Orchestes rusci TaxID=3066250 RepID=UPI00313B99E6